MSEQKDKTEIKDKQESLEEKKLKARRRRALTRKGPLHIDEDLKDPNFVYRIVNHSEGRSNINRMVDLGYEVVKDSRIEIGDEVLSKGSRLGSVVQRRVGTGVEGILMRIPKELWDEGQEEKDLLTDRNEMALKDQSGTSGTEFTKKLDNS